MISYELVKQLKDAGFPQRHKVNSIPSECSMWYGDKGELVGFPDYFRKTHCYIPTLSELIDACGTRFLLLRQNGEGEWFAFDNTERTLSEGNISERPPSKTPEEAVAKLWLKLNDKRTTTNNS